VAGALPPPTALIDDAAQRLEQGRYPVNLVDDDQPARLRPQISIRIVKPAKVGRAFEVEIDRTLPTSRRDLERQRGLADLARPEQHDTRHLLEPGLHSGPKSSFQHSSTPEN
jgi:hypothetical protein